MDPLILVSVAVIVSILLALLYFLTRSSGGAAAQVEAVRARPEAAAAAAAAARGGRVRRHVQRRNHGPRLVAQNDSDEGEGLIDGDDDGDFDDGLQDSKVGAKKQRKLEEKEERRRQREAELQEREEKKKRDAERDEKRKKDEAREAAIQAEQEEEQRKKKEEQEKKDYEAYLALKQSFVVEEEGTEAVLSEQQADSLLQDFINYIQDVKVVMLEDLAAHFRLRTSDCIDRVKTLMAEGRLSGVMDDRGKFIHVTREEYESVAKFIKQRGRVSIGELVESSNRLIRLVPESEALRKAMLVEETVAS